ncbi:MAG: D-alanine--D-alanine ligase [Eudoraea sp.]|nr:D-alanine--D-alanine ligase [Eudoraea sp.]
MKKNIAIIMGGYSSEVAISLKSGGVVYTHLNNDTYKAHRIHILKEKWVGLDDTGKEFPVNRHDFSVDFGQGPVTFDCVFNAIHGSPGEDGYMQAYFALLGIPQTSCSYYQAALTFNKRDLLSVLKPYGVKCARSYHLNLGDAVDVEAIVSKVGLPCFVKANKAGSSFGISKVYKPEDIKAAVKNAFQEDDEILIEAALEGREVSVGVIRYEGQAKVLPITEIIPETDFFDYEAKYQGKSKEITPARISAEMAKKVTDVAAFVYGVLKMKGYARSEFIFVGDEPYMLEMNTTPGLTEESLLPQQAQAAGISLRRLFESAVEEALSQNNYF